MNGPKSILQQDNGTKHPAKGIKIISSAYRGTRSTGGDGVAQTEP